MKTHTINFRDFMNDDYKTKSNFNTTLFSVNTAVSVGSLLSPSPLIAKGYLVVSGIGFMLISLALVEKVLVNKKMFAFAEVLINFMKLFMPAALIAILIYFVYGNPLL